MLNVEDAQAFAILSEYFEVAVQDEIAITAFIADSNPTTNSEPSYAAVAEIMQIAVRSPLWLFNHKGIVDDIYNEVFRKPNIRDTAYSIYGRLNAIVGDANMEYLVKKHIVKAVAKTATDRIGGDYIQLPEGMKEQLEGCRPHDAFAIFLLQNPWMLVVLLANLNFSRLTSIILKLNKPV